jgi:5-methylcytosine-specific restriction enzyme A
MISKVMQTIITELPKAVNEPFKDNYLADYIRNEARDIIRDNTPTKYQDYFFKGSAGEGAWVKNKDAWIGIFNPKITSGAKQGYYLVYGFPINSNYIRFGIGQGFTEAQERYGSKNWENALDTHAGLMQLKIPSYADRFPSGQVEFTKQDGKSYYRSGFVYHRVYDVTNLPPEEELVEDLAVMLDAYQELYKKGGRNLDINIDEVEKNKNSFEAHEELYQSPPKQKTIKKSPKSAAIEDKELAEVKSSVSNVRLRNPDYGEEAKQNANHQCEISELHETFTRNKDDKNFTEAHHLIPYEQYDVFADKGLSLDRGCNIVSLCPNCHRNIHHGKKEDIGYLLEQLYKVRGQSLMEIYGCDINLLKSFYKAI